MNNKGFLIVCCKCGSRFRIKSYDDLRSNNYDTKYPIRKRTNNDKFYMSFVGKSEISCLKCGNIVNADTKI